MKQSIIAAIAAALSVTCGSVIAQTAGAQTGAAQTAAQSTTAENGKAQTKKASKSAPAKKAEPSTIQPVVIPKEAVANPDGTYSYTDKSGKKWIYGRTPFGISRVEDMSASNGGFSTTPLEQLTKTTDNGETVKFERQTPFGPRRWEKKKSELTEEERRIFESQQQPKPEANR